MSALRPWPHGDDGAWIVADHVGFVIDVSPAFCERFGWPAPRLIGQPITVLVPPALRHAHHMGFSRFVTHGRSSMLDTPLALTVLRGDGRQVPVEMTLRAACEGSRWTIAAELRLRDAA